MGETCKTIAAMAFIALVTYSLPHVGWVIAEAFR